MSQTLQPGLKGRLHVIASAVSAVLKHHPLPFGVAIQESEDSKSAGLSAQFQSESFRVSRKESRQLPCVEYSFSPTGRLPPRGVFRP